jgi:predicted ester cyclase
MPPSTPLTITRQNINDALYEALFVCELQQSDNPTTSMVAEAITRTTQRFGTDGCAGQMAQEFGDHPDAARDRMRWVRQLAARAGLPDGPQPLTGEPLAGQALGGTPAGGRVTGCCHPGLNGASPWES